MFLLCCYSYGEELINCYIDIKEVSIENKEKQIQNCAGKIKNDSNELFKCVIKSDEKQDNYLTCGFIEGEVFKCEKDRIKGDKCTKTDKTGDIDDCVKYNNQEAIKGQPINNPTVDNTADSENNNQPTEVEKMPCYPENHICNKYDENTYKGYYKLDFSDNGSEFFFLYKKNVRLNQNCTLKIFPCDFKVKNESKEAGERNVVFSNTTNEYNKEFIANINANLGNMAFFKYIGSCKYSECKNIGDNILSKPYYYKYVHDSSLSDDTFVSYFEKNIQAQYVGTLCNKYLANCIDIRPSDFIEALYNNLGTNNSESRVEFYNNASGVREEHLWFVESSQGASAVCLSVYANLIDNNKIGSYELNLDVGYCSDLNEDMTNLKYPEGLTILRENEGLKIPNCYLKSCIDLTKEELEIINSKGKPNKKYCSEYYWLSNHKGLKYFPKEKPIFCSELEYVTEKTGKQLKFRYKKPNDGSKSEFKDEENGLYKKEICSTEEKNGFDLPDLDEQGNCKKIKRTEYYSYGGGRNKNKDNCYLKNCFSLTEEERRIISEAKFINIGFEIERAFALDGISKDVTNYEPSNIPVYCDNGFLFNNKFPGYEKFDYLNLNIIPCDELKNKHSGLELASNLDSIPFSTILDKKHDTTNEYRLCRSSYKPLNNLEDNKEMSQSRSFFETIAVIADETDKSKEDTKSGEDKKDNLPKFPTSEYKMVKFSNQELKNGFKSSNIYLYSNICSYVDNNFLYYNAEISSLKSSELKTNEKLAGSLEKFKNKIKELNPKYKACLEGARVPETLHIKNEKGEVIGIIDNKCTDCLSNDNTDKCLYDFTEEDCKKYVANEYYCKREYCKGDEKYCSFEDNLKEKLVNCSSYKSLDKETNYFDCELYFNTKNDHKDDILSLFKVKNNSEVETIRKACESMLPPKETRDLVESNLLYKLAKPNKVDISSYKSDSKYKPGKYDLERYGCAKYDIPDFGHGLYGCKLPDSSSSYISTRLHGTMANGEEKPSKAEIKFSDKSSQNNNINQIIMDKFLEILHNGHSSTGINVCSRYPNSIYDNKCGQREGSVYIDNKCITLTEKKKSDTLEDPESNSWLFTESTGATRFRMSRTNRDVFVFRDFHTYHYCYSNFKEKLNDGDSYGVIYGAGVLLFTLPAIAACAPLLWWAFLCVPIVIASYSVLYTVTRMEEWKINLQNDLHIPRGYATQAMCSDGGCQNSYHDKGMITKALLTNNDNYVYRFYPRSDKIEIDIKNKLENNVKGKDRFFYETTLGVDIIKKCKLSNLLTNLSACSDPNNCDYNYQFNKLDAKGNVIGSCDDMAKIKDCLDPALVECIDSYGVRFFDENADFNDINLNLTLHKGGFLKKYKKGDIANDNWGTSSNEKTRTWVPVDIVYYTKDTQTEEQLKDNENCKMGIYGDPIGDLARCRGFEINCKGDKDIEICRFLSDKNSEFKDYRGFYTESQSVKVPLFGSPFFFYTLITPRNTPNLFDPSFFLKAFFYYYNDNERVAFISNDGVILDFFNPKLVFEYDYNGGSGNSSYKNSYENENNYISQINSSDSSYSPPYVVKYKSDMITEREYNYALQKSYSMGLHEEYIPEVKVYRIKAIDNNDDSNYKLKLDSCKNQSAIRCAKGDDFISVDNNVASYKRAPLSLNNFTLKQLTKKQIKDAGFTGAYFINPRIEVLIGPIKNSYSSTKSNSGKTYLLTQGKDKYIKDFGKSDIQGYGINLTRSYCSKLYYDYYEYLDMLEREKKDKNDPYEINRLNKIILTIENNVRKECDQENGEETEILINESEMFTEKDKGDDKSKVIVAKETAIVRKYNESYGGFNEVCISDYDIEKIFELRKEYGIEDSKMKSVLVFKDINNRQRKTKCVLDKESRKRRECLIADKVYIYCNTEQIRLGSDECKEYLDLNTMQRVWVKTFNCYDSEKKIMNSILTKDLNEITIEEIEMLKACFKGGFNYSGNVQKDSSNDEGGTDFVDPCLCELIEYGTKNKDGEDNQKPDLNLFTVREMTPREYGLCVDLEKPLICPAVRYYGINKEYIDANLALNKTKKELDAEGHQSYYEQHLWRTEEKQVGIVPSVFYTKTLGHAEFPASIYCSDYEEDCIGGSKIVTGQCYGYWKQNGDRVPKAICTKTKTNNGNFYYEYKLYSDKGNGSNECIRYSCPKIGYDSENNKILDEKDIESKSSELFAVSEVNDFVKISRTDYTSFTNNEETIVEYVDKRGAFNGFAIWKGRDTKIEDLEYENLEDKYSKISDLDARKPKDQRSGDFAIKVQSSACLTGFAPAGSNANIHYPEIYGSANYSKDPQSKYDYVSNKSINFKKNLKEITLTYKNQNSSVGQIINSRASKLPVRLCNQKGEWQASNDVYNLLLIDKNNKNNNFYYNDPNNFWFKNLQPSDSTENRNNALENSKYCERLVCRELDSNNENVYLTEFFDSLKVSSKDKTWSQNGGAYWSATSAPRNSSNLVTTDNDKLTPDKSSIDIVKIYTNKPSDSENFVENKYKHVKKVRGICRNEYGYYSRGTNFSGNFTKQVDFIRDNKSSNKNTNLLFTEIRKANKNIDSIDSHMINKGNSTPPYRMCTSTGLWGGITDRCFRACEMLDIFRTNIDEKLYKDKQNFKDGLFVENHDIHSLNVNYIPDTHKEERFVVMNLRDRKLESTSGGLKYGDYLTGGAQWHRSIVAIDSSIETEGPKKGMRYIEVEGNCDKSYDIDVKDDFNSDPTQYSRSAKGISPKRKCYEDGTWGSVYGNTRCALSKSCSDFPFVIADLAELIENYNNNLDLIGLNKILSVIYQIRKKEKEAITKNCGLNSDINIEKLSDKDTQLEYDSCRKINTFQAINSTAEEGEAISYEKVFQYSDLFKEKYDSPGYVKIEIDEASKENEEDKRSMVCNKSAEQSNYVAGWSFKQLDLENYFIPRTCEFKLTGGCFLENTIDNFDDKNDKTIPVEVGYLNRLNFANTSIGKRHYSKESLLQVVYNELNRGSNEKYNEKLYSDGNGVIDNSYKNVEIGNKSYLSYQLSATCDNKYFYNEIIGNNYYNKHIVFECSGNTCKGNNNCKFMHHKKTGENSNFIKADACLPKTCGDNIYQPSWSKSYVKEVIENVDKYNIGGSKESSLNCNKAKKDSEGNLVESAFVAKDLKDTTILDPYKNYLATYGFASAIKVQCSATRSMEYYSKKTTEEKEEFKEIKTEEEFKKINGKTAENTYDAHRYGDLSLNDVAGKEFCTDLAKNKCKVLTEAEIANGAEFRNKYCVKMVCPKTGLKLKDGKILTDQTGTDTFSLPGKEGDYIFDTVVAIQSLAGDFDYYRSKNSYSAPNPDYKYVQYDNAGTDNGQIGGIICPDNQDIYNTGAPADYSYDVYYSNTSEDKVTVANCFNNLESTDAIKIDGNTSCDAGYENKNGVCIKYSQVYKEKIKLVSGFFEFSKLITGYTLPNENDFRIKVAKFIVEKILFDNPKYSQSVDIIKYINENIIQKANESAKDEATKKFDESSAFCFYDYDESVQDEFKKSNLTEIALDKNKYGDIMFFTYKHDDNQIFGYIPDTSGNKCQEKYKIEYGISVTCKKDDKEENKCVSKETAKDKYCENGYSSVVVNDNHCELKKTPLIGEKYQLIDVFNEAYDAAYKIELKKLKEEFKKALANADPPALFKELFEEYYKIFKMGEFLSFGSNLNLYKSFLSDVLDKKKCPEPKEDEEKCPKEDEEIKKERVTYLVNYEKGANGEEKSELETIYGLKFISFYKILDDDTNAIITPSELSNSKYHCVKIEVKTDNNVVNSEVDCKEEIYESNETFLSHYKKYFVNFIGSAECESLIEGYGSNFNSEKTICEGGNDKEKGIYKDYKDYYDNTYKQEIEGSKSNYKNGLYMVMKCEPDGWKISDSVVCKSRCTGCTGDEELDPEGAGKYTVSVEFNNMRFSDSANITFSAFANSSCINRRYSKSRNFSIKCENGNNEEGKLSYNANSTVPAKDWWLVEDPWHCFGLCVRCRTYAKMDYSSSNNKKYSRKSYYAGDEDSKDMVGVEPSKVLYVGPNCDNTSRGGTIDCGIVEKTPTRIIYHINNKN